MTQQLSLDGYEAPSRAPPPTPPAGIRLVRGSDGGWRFVDADGTLLLHPTDEPEDPLPGGSIAQRVRSILQNPSNRIQ